MFSLAVPEFVQGPVVCGTIFLVLNLYCYDGAREQPFLPVFGYAGGQEVRRQWGVQCVR